MSRFLMLSLVAASVLVLSLPARAYVDLAPTLARIVRESKSITLAEVARFNSDKGAVILKKTRDLKGESDSEPIKHLLVRANESVVDRPLLEWAEPGRRCVIFVTGKAAVVCVGEAWYQAHQADDGWWRIGSPRPDLPLAYYGSISRLADAIPLIVAGKSAVITTLPHGMDREGASFDLALNRANLPGMVKVQRLRASKTMPDMAMGVGANPAFVLGTGRVGKEDLAALRQKLQAAEASVRAESAADLGFLDADAAEAAGDLAKLLDDEAPFVRLAAASALLRIKSNATRSNAANVDSRAMDVLAAGLKSDDPVTRRRAARAVGLAGGLAAPLADKLGALLNDSDVMVRCTALQAIATLGPVAVKSAEPVTALLGQSETAIDAADALGRIGPAASRALTALAKMLESEAPAQRWAAVRAMCQIGGEDAGPAVKFMIQELPKASEVDGYNMLIYLALLGPVAKDAIPAVRSSRVRNPVLRQITAWAIDPSAELPNVQMGGGFGEADFVQYIFEAYVRELGDHLKPKAQALAKRIMSGKGGNVPPWGYKMLARFPEDSLAILTPGLADKDLAMRERATVALGYMGRAAQAARPKVAQALKAAQDEREQRLLKWCLRELE